MGDLSLSSLFGGLPFLDRQFDSRRFLTAVACVRHHHAVRLGWLGSSPDEHMLDVSTAAELRSQLGMGKQLRATSTCQLQLRIIHSAISSIIATMPDWSQYFRIPLRYHAFDGNDVISFSTYSHPQQIFLGSRAFASDMELREQIIHELTHTWTYMVEEIWRLHDLGDPTRFRLPSGTADRSATEVVSAALVAAVLCAYYERTGETARVASLRSYLQGCLELVNGYHRLTPTGREVVSRLRQCLGELGGDAVANSALY